MALALPVGDPGNNVYMSINLEANYVLPSQSTQFTQDFFDKIFFISGVNRNETEARLDSINFFSRENFFRIVENKLEAWGYDGKNCMLRFICEMAKADVISGNGVIGSIFHVLFT